MGFYLAIPLLIFAAALQTSILPGMFAGSAQPELVLIIILSWSIHAEWEEALFWVFTGGIIQDLVSITPTGTSILSPLIVVFIMTLLGRALYRFNVILIFLFVAIGTVLHHIAIAITLTLTGYAVDPGMMIQTYSLPTIVYNLLAVIPIYWILRRIQNRIPRPQSAWDVNTRV
jgi:rod shape-determining protein MreD